MGFWSKTPKCLNVTLLSNSMPFITSIKQLVLPLDVLDAMTEVTNITEDIAKDYPIDGSVYLTALTRCQIGRFKF